ncbi:MAG: putative rane protein [Miltoncostaeaceae bacterium]|nr:putative rane protein [Miltoncostaeaceae bacterium]
MDETTEATRRTRLSSERTWLAWLRTGLAAFGVGLATGSIIPKLTSGAAWPYVTVGIGFASLGMLLVGVGVHRHRAVEAALQRGEYAALDDRLLRLLGVVAVLLGVAIVAVLIFAD